MSYRLPKVNKLLKRELGQIIFREEDFGQGVLVTVTEVQTSANLQNATVKISILPENKAEKAFKTLNRHIFILQKILDKKLFMRPVPKICFVLDRNQAKASKIEELINQAKNEKRVSENKKNN